MRKRVQGLVASGVLAVGALAVPSAGAQVRGIPVYNSGILSGFAIYGDVGLPDDDSGEGTALAVSGRVGFGAFGATAILSTFDPEGSGDSDISVGATLNYKIFGDPLTPLSVTLQGGVGYSKPDAGVLPDDEVDEFRFPIGAGFALTIPNPALAIKPWIAPRLDIVQTSGNGPSTTESNFGLGGGLELNLLNGLGVQAAYDRVFTDGGDLSVFGFGAHYSFGISGL